VAPRTSASIDSKGAVFCHNLATKIGQDRTSKHVMDTDEQNGRTLASSLSQTNGQAMTEQILSAMKQQNDMMALTIAVSAQGEKDSIIFKGFNEVSIHGDASMQSVVRNASEQPRKDWQSTAQTSPHDHSE
jgi:hypothetical protein